MDHNLAGYRSATQDEHSSRGNELESDDEDRFSIFKRYQEQRHNAGSTSPNISRGLDRSETTNYQKPPNLQFTASSADTVDGYDSFENTNNKKKRKIPISGSIGNHHSSLSIDMAQMDIRSDHDTIRAEGDGGVGQYYGSGSSAVIPGSSGTGISGAGRGRFGRTGVRIPGGRSPLGISTNGSNALHSVRSAPQRKDFVSSGGLANSGQHSDPDQGIISAAIANAAASPSTPTKGQENVSLLEQQSTKPPSTKTQFTFTCESDSSKGMVWPEQQSPSPAALYQTPPPANNMPTAPSQYQKGFSTQGTQTSPTMANQPHSDLPGQARSGQAAAAQPRKPRRSPGRQYAINARRRRMQQEYKNYHHPPNKEELWICEFCEYESIFGTPPEALVRQYEIKDRRERKRLAEKRRLLEKAKMKGKKGKKGNKNAAKNATTQSQPPASNPQYDQQQVDPNTMQHQGTQSEEYLADDYDEDPIPIPNPLPQAASKIPQPVNQHYNPRLAAGDSGAVVGSVDTGRAA